MTVVLNYEDSEEFYKNLNEILKTGEPVEIRTEFSNAKEVPSGLSSSFGGAPFLASSAAISGAMGFVHGAKDSYVVNWVIVIAGIGAVIGAFAGPIGAVVGAGVGAIIGFMASLVSDQSDREISLEVSSEGKLIVKIKSKARK